SPRQSHTSRRDARYHPALQARHKERHRAHDRHRRRHAHRLPGRHGAMGDGQPRGAACHRHNRSDREEDKVKEELSNHPPLIPSERIQAMPTEDPRLRYDTVAMTLHWLIALLVVANVCSGIYFAELAPKGTVPWWVVPMHK